MDFQLDDEFRSICQEIVSEDKTEVEWAEVEASDMFQTQKYNGGFDADEGQFCFSVFLSDGEFWFQVSLEQVQQIAKGKDVFIEMQNAEY